MSIAEPRSHRRPEWFTSSYSNGAGGECVECAMTGERALVRDSKCEKGPVLTIGHCAWGSFVGVLKHGHSTH